MATSASTAAWSMPCTTGRQRARAPEAARSRSAAHGRGGRGRPRTRQRPARARPTRRAQLLRRVVESAGSTATAGTAHARSSGVPRGAGPGAERTSPGDASGPPAWAGSRSVTWVGVPGCRVASAAAGTANGCGRAVRRARLRPVAGRSPSSAHSSTPRPGDHRACTTSIPPPYDRTPTPPPTPPDQRESAPLPARVGTFAGASGQRRQSFGRTKVPTVWGQRPSRRGGRPARGRGSRSDGRCTRGRTGSPDGPGGRGCAPCRAPRGSASTRARDPRRRRRSRCG